MTDTRSITMQFLQPGPAFRGGTVMHCYRLDEQTPHIKVAYARLALVAHRRHVERYPADDDETLLVHHEVMSGPLAWLIKLIYRDRIERGLKLVDESIAERAEFLATTTDTAPD